MNSRISNIFLCEQLAVWLKLDYWDISPTYVVPLRLVLLHAYVVILLLYKHWYCGPPRCQLQLGIVAVLLLLTAFLRSGRYIAPCIYKLRIVNCIPQDPYTRWIIVLFPTAKRNTHGLTSCLLINIDEANACSATNYVGLPEKTNVESKVPIGYITYVCSYTWDIWSRLHVCRTRGDRRK